MKELAADHGHLGSILKKRTFADAEGKSHNEQDHEPQVITGS
jgi:hypothetical protein